MVQWDVCDIVCALGGWGGGGRGIGKDGSLILSHNYGMVIGSTYMSIP